jgi:hypothetical protein
VDYICGLWALNCIVGGTRRLHCRAWDHAWILRQCFPLHLIFATCLVWWSCPFVVQGSRYGVRAVALVLASCALCRSAACSSTGYTLVLAHMSSCLRQGHEQAFWWAVYSWGHPPSSFFFVYHFRKPLSFLSVNGGFYVSPCRRTLCQLSRCSPPECGGVNVWP